MSGTWCRGGWCDYVILVALLISLGRSVDDKMGNAVTGNVIHHIMFIYTVLEGYPGTQSRQSDLWASDATR